MLGRMTRRGSAGIVIVAAALVVGLFAPKVLAADTVSVSIIGPPGTNITAGPHSGQSVGFPAAPGQPLVFRVDPYAYAATDYAGHHVCMVFQYWSGLYSTEDATKSVQGLAASQETPYTIPNDAVSVNFYASYAEDPNWVYNVRWQCIRR
jgi:hypothetical protein